MTIIEAVIQGAVQGLTEFLPVSSSGHLTITQHVLGIDMEGGNLFFNVVLHIGTLIAVVAFYHKLIWRLIKAFFSMIGDIFTGKFKWKELSDDKRMVIMVIIGLIPLALLFLPVPGTGMKLKDFVESFNTDKYFIVVGICLLITSLLLFVGNLCSRRNASMKHAKSGDGGRTAMNILDAIVIGITQCFATLPGLSRSGSTLSAGQMRGLNKQTALDYTFILGTPAIIAAALLEGKDALETGNESLTANPYYRGNGYRGGCRISCHRAVQMALKNRQDDHIYYLYRYRRCRCGRYQHHGDAERHKPLYRRGDLEMSFRGSFQATEESTSVYDRLLTIFYIQE